MEAVRTVLWQLGWEHGHPYWPGPRLSAGADPNRTHGGGRPYIRRITIEIVILLARTAVICRSGSKQDSRWRPSVLFYGSWVGNMDIRAGQDHGYLPERIQTGLMVEAVRTFEE